MGNIKVYTNFGNEHYAVLRAVAPRKCVKGCVIEVGEGYTAFVDISDHKITSIRRVCWRHTNRCEQCGQPMEKDGIRFCSDGCAQRHFNLASVESEEKQFWGE